MGMTMGEYLEKIRNGEILPPVAGGDPELHDELQKAHRQARRSGAKAPAAKKAAKRARKPATRTYKRASKASKGLTPADLDASAVSSAATTPEA